MPTLRRIWPLALAALCAAALPADEMDVPVSRQVPLLTRVLSFDRSLEGDAPLVVAVVHQPQHRPSLRAYQAFAEALRARRATVQGREVRLVAVEATSAGATAARLRRAGAEAAYVAPLRGLDVRALSREAGQAGVLTLTGVRGYVGDGVAVGVGLRDGRPEILLNRRAVSAAGADLSARLLQLATLVD